MDRDPSPERALQALRSVLEQLADPEARAWFERAMPRPGQPLARGQLFGAYAGAGRRLARAPALDTAQQERLRAAGMAAPDRWSAPALARAALLLGAMATSAADTHVALATEAFRKGDNAERAALLRALPLLPQPERFVELAVEACRTHVLDVFEAIACDNPFPAAHFPEHNFNQLVIKTLFMELPLARVLGVSERNNAELVRIAGDYEAERRAAGRAVPADIAMIRAS